MEEESEPCARLCGNCAHFRVLDDYPRDPRRWFGVCDREASRDLGCECGTVKALDWAFDYGRHGDDGCEKPGEWFEEDR